MAEPAEDIEPFLATAAEMLIAEGMTSAADLLKAATIRTGETGYDNWNGGTYTFTVFLEVDPATFAQLGDGRAVIEEQIGVRLKAVVESYSANWYTVSIVPKVSPRPDWRETKGDLSQVVRRNIIDGLKLENVAWAGRLEDVEFLERIYDLRKLPSQDPRFQDAAGDIWQHRVNNPEDWPDDWIYADSRFNLIGGPSDAFLRFLCEVVHPVVRPDRNEALKLVQQFNDQLRQDGWGLVE